MFFNDTALSANPATTVKAICEACSEIEHLAAEGESTAEAFHLLANLTSNASAEVMEAASHHITDAIEAMANA